MSERKSAAYRLGLITLVILAVLTIVEFFVALYVGSIIVQNFMHIARLWRQESH